MLSKAYLQKRRNIIIANKSNKLSSNEKPAKQPRWHEVILPRATVRPFLDWRQMIIESEPYGSVAKSVGIWHKRWFLSRLGRSSLPG